MKFLKMKKFKKIIGFSVLCTCVTLFCYIFQFRKNGIATDPQYWALFGDYIGGVLGAFFGLISILVVCWTFFRQDESQRIQQLDSSFFNLLSVQQRIIDSIKGRIKLPDNCITSDLHGFDYINQLAETIQKRGSKISVADDYGNKLIEFYNESEINENMLGYYFRHLYHIFKYVDSSNVPNETKKRYIDIIQAQMNDNELYLCFINSYSEYGEKRFKPLLEKYCFFENIKSHGSYFDKLKEKLYLKTNFKHIHKETNH